MSLAGEQGLSGDGAAIPSCSEESSSPHWRRFCHETSACPYLWALQGCAFPWDICAPLGSVSLGTCARCQCAQIPFGSQVPPACAHLRQQLWMDTGAPAKCVQCPELSAKKVQLFSLSMVAPVKQECCIQENLPFL